MVCYFGRLLEGLNWECSQTRSNFSEWKLSKEGSRKVAYLNQAFSDISEYSLPEEATASICSKCEETFTSKPSTSCKGLNHPITSRKVIYRSRLAHFITAREYITTYLGTNLKPNNALCKAHCYKTQLEDVQSLESKTLEPNTSDYKPPATKKTCLSSLNQIVQHVDGVDRVSFGKRNVAAQSSLVQRTIENVDSKLRTSFQQQGLKIENPPTDASIAQLKKDSEDLHNLMDMLKLRIQDCSKAEMRSLLTLCPKSWTHTEASDFFEVPKSLIRSSRKQARESSCILPKPKTKNGKKLSADTKSKVLEFYNQDDISRCCPGAKDVVSVKDPVTGKREKKQKRYLLANLKELYEQFKVLNPTLKIGISSFVSLRPQEILSYTTKGHHNVCLCIYHENVKLLFNAINEKSIKPHIASMVCDVGQKNCMYRRCDSCKDKSKEASEKITEIIQSTNKAIIRYKRWLTTDGTAFVEEEKTAQEFGNFILAELEALLKHHYLSRAQSRYFKTIKDNLKPGELIVWGDFAENYSPVIQDSIQSEYFNHKQITLHPFNVYLRYNEELFSFAFCIISDCTTHDTNSFFAFQSSLIKELRRQLSQLNIDHINQIYYFSDGCAAQYKNRKNFCNLFYHNLYFSIKAEWNFFPTAHGKGPCDGHGGTTKRLARIASLRGETITTAEHLFNWAKINISHIEYLLVTKAEVDNIVESFNLAQRYDELKTVHGTQQSHCVKIEGNKVLLYETSEDTQILTSKTIGAEIYCPAVEIDECSVDDWIAGAYSDGKWYVGKIIEVDTAQQEVHVSWYKGSSKKRGTSFSPERQTTWLPYGRILKKFKSPTTSSSGRTITVPLNLQDEFDTLLDKLLA